MPEICGGNARSRVIMGRSGSESVASGSDDRRRMPPVRQAHAITTSSAILVSGETVRSRCKDDTCTNTQSNMIKTLYTCVSTSIPSSSFSDKSSLCSLPRDSQRIRSKTLARVIKSYAVSAYNYEEDSRSQQDQSRQHYPSSPRRRHCGPCGCCTLLYLPPEQVQDERQTQIRSNSICSLRPQVQW